MELTTLNFHLTNNCNLRCKHCLYSSGEFSIVEMDFNLIRKFLIEFAGLSENQGTLNLYGGETLLRKDIFDIISFADKLGLKVGMTTNINVSKDILEKLAHSNIQRITVDMDGANPDTHDWLRNKQGHFKQTVSAIKLFKQYDKFVSVNSVLHLKNIDQVESILDLCKKLRIDSISFYLFTPLGRGKNIKRLLIGPEQWQEARERTLKWIKGNSPNFDIIWERSYEDKNKLSELPHSLCDGFPSKVIDVRCDGKVYFCGLLISVDGQSLGNIQKQSLKQIIGKRKQFAIKNKSGCAALALSVQRLKHKKLIDPRKSTKNLVPVCPYDWGVLSGNKTKIVNKFVHVDD